jgi:hypothetical protein
MMLVDLPDNLYACALRQCRDYFTTPDEQLEFWSRLGKAILDNPEPDVNLVADLVLAKMRRLTCRAVVSRRAEYCDKILESAGFSAACAVLPPGIRQNVGQTLCTLLDNETASHRLRGELDDHFLYQWGEESQLLQVGYRREPSTQELIALSLARRYVGL